MRRSLLLFSRQHSLEVEEEGEEEKVVVVEKSEEGVKEQEDRVGVRSLPARSMMRI